jgi:hypothetical protein
MSKKPAPTKKRPRALKPKGSRARRVRLSAEEQTMLRAIEAALQGKKR